MNKGRAVSGGGLTSNKLVTPKPRAGNRAVDAIDPAAADQIGQSIGFRGDPVTGKPMADKTDLGNFRSWTCPDGPGGGRTIYPSGYQDQHGAANRGEHNLDVPDTKGGVRKVGAVSDLGKDRSKWGDR